MPERRMKDGPICPLDPVDRRLEDAHRLWHQAEGNYFDPEGFRLAAQNTIQTLRTVTFILQNHKRIIPDFDLWYGRRQDRLREDALMRWMVDARNRIEKQGDLEAMSIVRADIIASYLDEGPVIEVPAHLFDNPGTLLRSIPGGALGKHLVENGTLRIQRRWVEKSLPEHELLDALAIAYGRITELVHDVHRQIGIPPPKTLRHSTQESFDIAALGWRMPCMIGQEEPRSLMISLSDGSTLHIGQKPIEVDPEKGAEAVERYPISSFEVMGRDYKTEEALAAGYFEMVRGVFLKDGYHLPFVFLFRDRKLVQMLATPADSPQQKYLLMRSLANDVVRHGADAAISVDEAWFAPQSDLAPYQRPAELATRKEGLVLTLVRKTGDPVEYIAIIERDGDTVSLGETSIVQGGAMFSFAPFYSAWNRPIPEEWLKRATSVRTPEQKVNLTYASPIRTILLCIRLQKSSSQQHLLEE